MWLKNGVAHKTNVYNNLQLVVLCTSSSTLQDYLEPCIQHSENIGPANNGKCSKNRYVVICLSFFSFRFVILDLCCHFIVILLSFPCHVVVVLLSLWCHFCIMLLSFVCHFALKMLIRYFLMVLS